MKTTITAPQGMSGLWCEPWTPGEIYAVAADWAQAGCPIRVYGKNGWWTHDEHGRQVADFRHNPRKALVAILYEALRASGDSEEEAAEQAEALAEEAEELTSADDDE